MTIEMDNSGRKSILERRIRAFFLIAIAVVAAFGAGMSLGRYPEASSAALTEENGDITDLFGGSTESSAQSSNLQSSMSSEATLSGSAGSESGTTRKEPIPGLSNRLRLRSTSSVSSSQAKVGDRLLFVTEDQIDGKSGQKIPAGSIVQGVVAEAARSTGEAPGSLVIEIRALYVGNEAIPVHALPYKSLAGGVLDADRQDRRSAQAVRDPKAMGIRTSLRVNPEAVVERESILEFELVDIDGFLPGVAEPTVEPEPKAPEIRSLPSERNVPNLDPLESFPEAPPSARRKARVSSV